MRFQHGIDADEETVYTVLAQRARSHSSQFLAFQAGLALAVAVALVVASTRAWPFAALVLALSMYSAWGLVDARRRGLAAERLGRYVGRALVVTATLVTLVGLAGAALWAFSGDRPSPYGACYEPGSGRAYSCDARGRRLGTREAASRIEQVP